MGYISAMLDTIPDACASLANAQQPPMKAVAACIQLVDHVTGEPPLSALIIIAY